MKRVLKIVGLAALIGVAVVIYGGYRIVWGHPFTINQLADRQTFLQLLENPEWLTSLRIVDGTILDFHSHELTPVGLERRDSYYAFFRAALEEVRRFDREALGPQDRITYDVLIDTWSRRLEFEKYDWLSSSGTSGLYPLNATFGPAFSIIGFMETLAVVNGMKTARNYVARLRAMGDKLDALTAEMRRQSDAGVVMPPALIETSIGVIDQILGPVPANHALLTGFDERMSGVDDIDESDRIALLDEAAMAVESVIYPAYRRMRDALAEERQRASGRSDGVDELPQGRDFYQFMIRYFTNTDYTADEVYAIGLAEVARIEAEMDALLKGEGLVDGTVAERVMALSKDPRFTFPQSDEGRAQVLDAYTDIIDEATIRFAEYFTDMPSAGVVVERMPRSSEDGVPGAYYNSPSLDGSGPGTFRVNLRDLSETTAFEMKSLAYHEAIPGHHLESAMALELEELPLIRRQAAYTAHGEGWALYAERLAWEAGMYEGDPFGNLGRLQMEMLRAVRLVVDSGIHARGWTHERSTAYLAEKTGWPESRADAEIQRYMAIPGQALAYKIGELKILELRLKARVALGVDFSIKGFHDAVLGNGPVPLSIMERVVDEWIESASGPGH